MSDGKRAVDLMGTYVQEWDDAVRLASNSSRISLAGPVGQLQRIRRDVQGKTWPECARRAQTALVKAMDYHIAGFTGFMGDRGGYEYDMDWADGAYQDFSRELALMTGRPTPVPRPTTDRKAAEATVEAQVKAGFSAYQAEMKATAAAALAAARTKHPALPTLAPGQGVRVPPVTTNRVNAIATATMRPTEPPLNTRTTGDASVDATVRALGR